MYKKYYLAFLVTFMLLMNGCAGKHPGIKEDRPLHLSKQSSPLLYTYAKDDILAHAPQSGFYPLEDHINSLAARLVLANHATKSIKVQYFTFSGDVAGTVLAKALIDAANRGVKVDILIDDIALSMHDDVVALINMHKNITFRVFNPTKARASLHYIEMGLRSGTVGRRMHNKAFIVDNSMAVYGGRNIGDIYFGTDAKHFFIDNDVLTAGPFVNQLNHEFEYYFTNKLSVDFEEIIKGDILTKVQVKLHLDNVTDNVHYESLKKALKESSFYKAFTAKKLPLYFADAELYYDMPQKITTKVSDHTYQLRSKVPKDVIAKKSFYMVSPYFIPNENMMKRIKELRDNGVDVAILTNSLESTDAISVYTYYADYQKKLLEMGVRLYEVHPDAYKEEVLHQSYNELKKMPRAGLHAKTIVIDDSLFVIGSTNMDPRSRNLNTELVSIIKSNKLNAHEKAVFKDMTSLKNAYTLELEYDENHQSKVIWKALINGKEEKFYNDGNAGLWLKIKKGVTRIIPKDVV